MRPKRKLFTIGPPYVQRVRKEHAADEGVQHLAASHESLRVMLTEAEDEIVEVKRQSLAASLEAARTAREVRRLLPPVLPDPKPCGRVYGRLAACRCPEGRCWFRDQADRHRVGLPIVSYEKWLDR